MKTQRRGIGILIPALMMAAVVGSAWAVTLQGLKGDNLDSIYGTYAPAGQCKEEPRITVGDSGITFTHAGQTRHAGTVELALGYVGPDYQGISQWIFPFPLNADEPGRVLMTFNDGEKPGALRIDSNLGPGQSFDAMEAALVKHSPYARCPG